MTNTSPSAYARRLLRTYLSDGQPHTTAQCSQFVRAHMPPGIGVTSSIITHALYSLVHDDPSYYSPARGYYQKIIFIEAADGPLS